LKEGFQGRQLGGSWGRIVKCPTFYVSVSGKRTAVLHTDNGMPPGRGKVSKEGGGTRKFIGKKKQDHRVPGRVEGGSL